MNTPITSKLVLSISLALGTVLAVPLSSAHEPERTVGTAIDDATITASVKTKLLADERTEGFDINVDTMRGVVTLRGGADSLAAKNAATTVAKTAKGVISVNNQLVVAAKGTAARTEANSATASGEVRKAGKNAAGKVEDAADDAMDRKVGTAIDDATITASVKTKLLNDKRTEGFDINVDTMRGVVTLRGGADTQADKNAASMIAKTATGVVSVNNQLVVAAKGTAARTAANTATASGEVRNAGKDVAAKGHDAAAKAHDGADRTVGKAVDDATITASVKTKLLEDERTEGFDINVDTMRGVVTLRGGADTQADKNAASMIAKTATGVVSVNNQLVVAAEGTAARTEANTATASGEVRKAGKEVAAATEDTWLTTKVKTKLLAESDVKGTDISVETKGNVVHLSGMVATSAARAEAIKIAENTEGVASVDASMLKVGAK